MPARSESFLKIHEKASMVFVKQNAHSERKFNFDGVFTGGMNNDDMYVTALLPLLETVLYKHKDATLLLFGPRNTGKSSLMGIKHGFHRTQNILNETLNYFYANSKGDGKKV